MSFPLQLRKFLFADDGIEMFVPDASAVKEAYQKGSIPFPYWSQVWPAAKALAQFLLYHPACTKAKRVVELGAGLGLPSLVAARNAAQVLCSDAVQDAVTAVKQSATHLGLQNIRVAVLDWRHLPSPPEADVLLLSDINYEPGSFALQLELVNTFLERKTLVLLSTPQRLMAKDFIASLLPFCARQEEIAVAHEGKAIAITVLALQKA